MQFYIITSRLFDIKNGRFTLGGVQTYVLDLYSLIKKKHHEVYFIQFEDTDKESEHVCDGFSVLIFPFIKSFLKSRYQSTFDSVFNKFNSKNVFFIIDSDQKDIKSTADNVIQIQHGIAFDIPGDMIKGFWGKTRLLQKINKFLRCYKNSQRLYHVRNTVCVDYNFYNWFRTLGTIYKGWNVKVIPNYSGGFITQDMLHDKLSASKDIIKIIFARRFFDYRGTLIMVDAVDKILSEYTNVQVTFAGEGPLEEYIKSKLGKFNDVFFTTFLPQESINIHYGFDIAVVPTIYSEGTSLSLCEAMSAACVPIATHVGGMTNILLDRFNGFLIDPSVDSLVRVMKKVIEMPKNERNIIATNAYNSVQSSFSRNRWEEQWAEYLGL